MQFLVAKCITFVLLVLHCSGSRLRLNITRKVVDVGTANAVDDAGDAEPVEFAGPGDTDPPLFAVGNRSATLDTSPDPCASKPGNLNLVNCETLGSGSNGVAIIATVSGPGLWLHVPTYKGFLDEGDRMVTKLVLKTSLSAWKTDLVHWPKNRRKGWSELATEAGAMAFIWGAMVQQEIPLFQKHMPAPVPSGLLMDINGIQWIAMEVLDGDWRPASKQIQELLNTEDPWKSVMTHWAAIVFAVTKLHVVGWQHCDLHLDNIFTRTNAGVVEVKFIDFGRAVPRQQGCFGESDADLPKLLCSLAVMLGSEPCGFDGGKIALERSSFMEDHASELREIADLFSPLAYGFDFQMANATQFFSTLRQYNPDADWSNR